MNMNVLTVRGGGFTDDDHDGSGAIDSDDTHAVIGVGAVFGESLQMDFAADFSDQVDNFVVSAIYRF